MVEFIERNHELATSKQIRNNPLSRLPGWKHGTAAAAGQPEGETNKKKKGDCNNWLSKGYCNKGDTCAWNHLPEKRGGTGPKGTAGKQSWDAKRRSNSTGSQRSTDSWTQRRRSTNPDEVCKFFLKGKCKKSWKECPYVHNEPCYFFKTKGTCKLGDKCLFPHRDPNGALVAAKAKASAAPAAAAPSTEGEAGADAQQAAKQPKAKTKAAAKKVATAAAPIASEESPP